MELGSPWCIEWEKTTWASNGSLCSHVGFAQWTRSTGSTGSTGRFCWSLARGARAHLGGSCTAIHGGLEPGESGESGGWVFKHVFKGPCSAGQAAMVGISTASPQTVTGPVNELEGPIQENRRVHTVSPHPGRKPQRCHWPFCTPGPALVAKKLDGGPHGFSLPFHVFLLFSSSVLQRIHVNNVGCHSRCQSGINTVLL